MAKKPRERAPGPTDEDILTGDGIAACVRCGWLLPVRVAVELPKTEQAHRALQCFAFVMGCPTCGLFYRQEMILDINTPAQPISRGKPTVQ